MVELMKLTTASMSRIDRNAMVCYLTYLVLFGLFCFSDLASRPIWLDETFSYYQVSSKSYQGMLDSFSAGVNAIPYFYFIVLWGFDQAFGLGPSTLRLPSLFFALAAIILLHRILKERFGNGIAFISCVSALLLTNGNLIHYSHEARPYSLYILAAVFCLYSCIALLKEESTSKRTLLTNSLIAFLLPAVHYVGIFYSFCAALAVLFVGRAKGRYFSLQVIGSFLFGWVLFILVHFSQMLLFINKKGLINPAWIPRPRLSQLIDVVLKTFSLSPVIYLALVASAGYYFFSDNTIRLNQNLDRQSQLINTFLFVAALFWLVIPPIFYFFSVIGLPNLSLQRYFAPSLLADALIAGFLLRFIIPENSNLNETRWFGISWISAGVFLAAIFLIYPILVAVKDIYKAPSYLSQKELKYQYITGSKVPCVTNNLHLFFEYTFNRGDQQVLYLLRKTRFEVGGFRTYNKQLPVVSKDELSNLTAFRFIYQHGSINNFPEFDIRTWGKDNHYEIADESKNGKVEVFLARKL